MIIGLQGQYDISVSLSGRRSYIFAMRLDHGDFRSTPVSGHLRIGGHVSKLPGADIGDAFEITRQALEIQGR